MASIQNVLMNSMQIKNKKIGPEADYFSNLDNGQFFIQHCDACGIHIFFPRIICPYCGSNEVSWIKPTGYGVVYSVSVIFGKPGAGTDYNVALIELEEGVRMMSRVEGISPNLIQIGDKVKARVLILDGKGLVVFDYKGGNGPQ